MEEMRSKRAFVGIAKLWTRRFLGLLPHLVGLAVVAWVLHPVFFHAHVSVPLPGLEQVLALRETPDDSTMRELAAQRPLGSQVPTGSAAVAAAALWLEGNVASGAAGAGDMRATTSSNADNRRAHELGIRELPFSSLRSADLLVQAYRAGGDVKHLSTARDLILSFARYERSAWLDRGLLWNDHAIAARVGVVIRFWESYRKSALFANADAAEILQHLARCAALLASPAHFTAWSNHGVMQNVALLQIAVAFPGLVNDTAVRRLAFERLSMQWQYYLSTEGVVLEHSSGYHLEGRELLNLAVRVVQMNGLTVPPRWLPPLELAGGFLKRLTRPDGTLPAFGDTRVRVPTVPRAPNQALSEVVGSELALYPLSGYAIWCTHCLDGTTSLDGSHSVATWSFFPGPAHKHADDPGFLLWADGRGWITASGYVPYSSVYRSPVEGWLGSNAPHGEGESPDPGRQSTLLGSASSPLSVLLDMQRKNTDGAGFRRQIASLGGRLWLVIDEPIGSSSWAASETTWTFYPDLSLEPTGALQYRLIDAKGHQLAVSLVTCSGQQATTSVHRGEHQPFAGWVATETGVLPTTALRVLTPNRCWTATLFDTRGTGAPLQVELDDSQNWRAKGAGWSMSRAGAEFSVQFAQDAQAVSISPPPDTGEAKASVAASLAAAVRAYPKYRNVDEYRWRVAQWLAALWLAQCLAYLAFKRRLSVLGWAPFARAAILIGWGTVGTWLSVVYFAT